MSLHGRVFAVAFILVILFGTITIAAVYLNKGVTDSPYTDPTSAVNSTEQTVQQWTSAGVGDLGWVAYLAIIFLLCTGILVFLAIRTKKR